MNTSRQQRGMSVPGILLIMIMVGFFLMCAIRMSPPYFEYLSVRDIVQRIILEPETATQTTGQIRRKIDNIFNSNQIYGLEPSAVDVYRKKGKTYINANYEVRVPVGGRIDAVLTFDDIHYAAGSTDPLDDQGVKK